MKPLHCKTCWFFKDSYCDKWEKFVDGRFVMSCWESFHAQQLPREEVK